MKFRVFFTVICMIAAATTSNSQGEVKPQIEVIGSSEMNLDPNIIVLSITIKEFEENRVKIPLEQIDREFLDALAKTGIEKKDIALSDLNVNSILIKRKERETVARKTYQVTFSNEKDVLRFLENSRNVRLENIFVSKLSHTEIAKYRLEVKIAALKAAEMKADALLETARCKRGKPILIKEVPDIEYLGVNRASSANAMYYSSNSSYDKIGSDDIQMKKINLRFEILVQYLID